MHLLQITHRSFADTTMGLAPPSLFPPTHIACHACLAQFIDMQQNPQFKNARKKRKKDWKKEIFSCVMTASLKQCHLAAWCWISFSIIGDVYLYHFVRKVKYHNIFDELHQHHYISKGKWYKYLFNNLILSEDIYTWENCIKWRKLQNVQPSNFSGRIIKVICITISW